MYAKIENNRLVKAPNYLVINNQKVWNASESNYIEQGYYPVIYTDAPETDDKHYAEESWTLENDQIIQIWSVIEIPTPSDEDELTDDQIVIVLTGGEL